MTNTVVSQGVKRPNPFFPSAHSFENNEVVSFWGKRYTMYTCIYIHQNLKLVAIN